MNVKLLVHVTRLGKTEEVVEVSEELGASLISRKIAEPTSDLPIIEVELEGETVEVELKVEEKPKKKRAKRKKKVVEEVKEEVEEAEAE